MKLTLDGLKAAASWEAAGVMLPKYEITAAAEAAKKAPVWVHFGAGNIFRIFLGSLADRLIAEGELAQGINCVETYDFDIIDKIYRPYDNLVLGVTLKETHSSVRPIRCWRS